MPLVIYIFKSITPYRRGVGAGCGSLDPCESWPGSSAPWAPAGGRVARRARDCIMMRATEDTSSVADSETPRRAAIILLCVSCVGREEWGRESKYNACRVACVDLPTLLVLGELASQSMYQNYILNEPWFYKKKTTFYRVCHAPTRVSGDLCTDGNIQFLLRRRHLRLRLAALLVSLRSVMRSWAGPSVRATRL